jgi:hypothetical protein
VELREGEEGRENDRASVISYIKHHICAGRGYKDVY